MGGGNAYDFCFDNKTLGYIVVSESTGRRLKKYYPVRSNCTIPVTSTTDSNSSLPVSSSSEFYSNSTNFSSRGSSSNDCPRKKDGTPDYRYKACRGL